MMIRQPITAVWEITMGCNMHCKHCGSACHEVLLGELTTQEALRLCDAIGQLGLKWVTLSGGEPTTRKDWPVIAGRLKELGVIPTMITNGWLFDEKILEQAIQAGVATIGFSLDGLQKTHDFMRREGSYQKTMRAIELCLSRNMNATAITTVNKMNLGELDGLKKELVDRGVKEWQVQIGCPMGNMAEHDDLVIEPADLDAIIDLAYRCMQESSIRINLGDCVGYYSLKEIEMTKSSQEGTYCRQCTAGKYTFGILHNGDIVGCTSIRNPEFTEDNVRNTPLREIWENPDSFSWSRTMKKEDLQGFCQVCRFAADCLGGCSNSRLTMGGSIYAENRYCSYFQAAQKRIRIFEEVQDDEELAAIGRSFTEKGYWQLAETALGVALRRQGSDSCLELLSHYGYVNFRLGNFYAALEANDRVLQRTPADVYGLKGKGLCLLRLGKPEEGIKLLQKAVTLTDESFMDPYNDLAIALWETGRKNEAIAVLEEGRKKSESFAAQSEHLYQQSVKKASKAAEV
mgnify:CR=1 FL=1